MKVRVAYRVLEADLLQRFDALDWPPLALLEFSE